MSHAFYRLHKAVRSLTDRQVHKRQWLASHYVLHLLLLSHAYVPVYIEDDFRDLRRDLTKIRGFGISGTLEATVNTMKDPEVDNIVHRILSMYHAMRRFEGMSCDGILAINS